MAFNMQSGLHPKIDRFWHTRGNGRLTPLFIPTAGRWILFHRTDVAGLRFTVEMQLDSASVELKQHLLDPSLDRRMVRAVAGDKFLDDGSQRCGRQLSVGDAHGVSVLGSRLSITPLTVAHRATAACTFTSDDTARCFVSCTSRIRNSDAKRLRSLVKSVTARKEPTAAVGRLWVVMRLLQCMKEAASPYAAWSSGGGTRTPDTRIMIPLL